MAGLSDVWEVVESKNTGIYDSLSGFYSYARLAEYESGSEEDCDSTKKFPEDILVLEPLRAMEQKYALKINPSYSPRVKDALYPLMGFCQAMYEVSAAKAVPFLDALHETNWDGTSEEESCKVALQFIFDRYYPDEFKQYYRVKSNELAREIAHMKDIEINVLDWQVRQSPLFPLASDIIPLACEHKFESAHKTRGEISRMPVYEAVFAEPTTKDYLAIAKLILEDARNKAVKRSFR